MAKVIVYGVSDDLIEVEGAITEEFNWYHNDADERRYLAFSDGTVLGVLYDKDGIWRLPVVAHGDAALKKEEGSVTEDTNDRVTLEGDLTWVLFGDQFVMDR